MEVMIAQVLLRTILVAIMISPPSLGCLQCPMFFAWNIGAWMTTSPTVGAEQQTPQETPHDRSVRKSTESFVNLIVRLREDGTTEIVRATQVDGKLIERRVPATNYIYEITKDGNAYAVGFLPEAAFSLRGFRDKANTSEKTAMTRSTTITLNIPDTALDAAKQGRLGLRIYKLNAGTEVEAISLATLKKIVSKENASLQYELSGAAVASQVKLRSQVTSDAPN
jgi:hypothetical protein